MLVAFVMTLAGTRFYTRMARVRGWGSAIVGDVHVHHLVPGVVLSRLPGHRDPAERKAEAGPVRSGSSSLPSPSSEAFASPNRPRCGPGSFTRRKGGGSGEARSASPLARRAGSGAGSASTI